MRFPRPTTAADRDLAHYLDLARHGHGPRASSGAQRAALIALVIIHEAPGLDHSARRGLKLFIDLAYDSPDRASELIAPR